MPAHSPEYIAEKKAQGHGMSNLNDVTAHCWPTPTTRDHKDGRPNPNVPVNGLLDRMWPTPTSLSGGSETSNPPGNSRNNKIREHAIAATYPTPEAGCYGTTDVDRLLERRKKYQEKYGNNGFGLTLGQFAMVEQHTNGSSVPTEKRGALNPEFVCWLMGFPQEWVSCGVSAMRLIQDRRRNSSPRRRRPSQTPPEHDIFS